MKSTIGVFRSLDVRFTHAEFAASFRRLTPVFVAQLTEEIRLYLRKEKTAYYDIPLKQKFFMDPVYPMLKKTDFTPWLQFDSELLSKAVSDIDIYEIYEPYFFYSSQIADLASKKGMPLVTEIWTSFPEHPSHYMPPYNLLVNNVVQKTNLFVLRSQKAISYLKPFKISEQKKEVIYHGVDLERFYPSNRTHDKVVILFVGALAQHKGLDDLLAVFPNLVDKYPKKVELVVCGVGPLSGQVKKLSMTLPISYKGSVPHTKLPEVYRSADIYCQPSKDYYFFGIKGGEEFAGYTFMEAMASGLPVVATYCGGIPEIIGTENRLLTQGDRQKLFEALDVLIAEHSLRKETGIKNRERVETMFDLKKQTKLLEDIIKNKLM